MNPALKAHTDVRKTKKSIDKHFFAVVLLVCLVTNSSFAQHRVLDIGIRLQKTVNLYYENGFTLQYSDDGLFSERLYFGFSYITSRLGTAINSNAIKQDHFVFSPSLYFRPKRLIRPMVKLNLGYFIADLEENMFDDLPNQSLLASSEAGLCLDTKLPLKISASLGYNFITGNGTQGPGTLYPLFVQTSLTWNVLTKGEN